MSKRTAILRSTARRGARRGSTMVELAVIFLPFIVLLTGVFEVGRAMWTYHTLAGAAKMAARHTIVRGARCAQMSANCPSSVGQISSLVRTEGLGLDPNQLELVLSAGSESISCRPLASCLSTATTWPTSPNNDVGRRVTIRLVYPFRPILGSFWPQDEQELYSLSASSSESIQF